MTLTRCFLIAAALLPLAAQQPPRLDTTTFVVLGDGLAAGMANYGLNEVHQAGSFPAVVARQMGAIFPQPLMQGPGVGEMLGYPNAPLLLPVLPQNRVRTYPAQRNPADEAPSLFVFNLSVPGMKLSDSLRRKPTSPLISKDLQQTAVNMILGFPSLIFNENVPLWSQFDYARAMQPTLALVELGYAEVLEATVSGEPARIPSPQSFRADYLTLVRALRDQQTQVIVTTIPDPIDTAYVNIALTAANVLRTPSWVLLLGYNITVNDYVTRNGLNAIGPQLFRRQIETPPAGSIMRAAVATDIRNRVRALNTEIANVARETGAHVYDLNAYIRRVRTEGATAGSVRVNADFLGGFYSLDGYHPGATGHALIANDLLGFINRTFGKSFPLADVAAVVRSDAVAQYRLASGPVESGEVFGIVAPAGEK
jgi:hypothetical protein